MASALRRQVLDIRELANESPFPVLRDVSRPNVVVTFCVGPPDTPYEGALFAIRMELTDRYPWKSPSVGFLGKSVPFHPNVDVKGAVCVDALNESWRPTFSLSYIVDGVIPMLLANPNPDSPLNTEAAEMYTADRGAYKLRAHQHARRHSVAFFNRGALPVLAEDVALDWTHSDRECYEVISPSTATSASASSVSSMALLSTTVL